MAISYPISYPSSLRVARVNWRGVSVTSRNVSPFTLQVQQYNWSGQGWMGDVQCPPLQRADAEELIAFLLAAQRGTFYFKDPSYAGLRGTITGTLTSATAVANTTTLTYTNTGSGSFANGDYLQIGTSLHKVIQVNSATSVDVFPVLRQTYTSAAITISNPQGVFRLSTPSTDWSVELARIYGISFSIIEDVAQ